MSAADLKDDVLPEEVERRKCLIKRMLLELFLRLSLHRGRYRKQSPHLYRLNLHASNETLLLRVLHASKFLQVAARVLKVHAPGDKEEIFCNGQSASLFVVSVNVAEAFAVSRFEVELLVRGIVEREVGFAVRDLVVEFMFPWLRNEWELIVGEASKYHFLVPYLALHQDDHVCLSANGLHEALKLGRVLVLVLSFLKGQLPFALNKLCEAFDFITN